VEKKFFKKEEVLEIVPIPSNHYGYSQVGVQTINGLYWGEYISLVQDGIALFYVDGYDPHQTKATYADHSL